MLVLGTIIGGGFAVVLFTFTVVGLPLLMEREVDFITAIITSCRAVAESPGVMAVWGALIAIWLFVAIVPGFLGLLFVLPVLYTLVGAREEAAREVSMTLDGAPAEGKAVNGQAASPAAGRVAAVTQKLRRLRVRCQFLRYRTFGSRDGS